MCKNKCISHLKVKKNICFWQNAHVWNNAQMKEIKLLPNVHKTLKYPTTTLSFNIKKHRAKNLLK